jgi:hypothetical protein
LYQQGEEAMPADKLGRYMTSRTFLERANAAVAEAVRALEAKGIKPVFSERGSTDEATRAVLAASRADDSHKPLCNRLTELSRTPTGACQVNDATAAIASALLLAKTAMPSEETKFLGAIREQLAPARVQPALVEWVRLLIQTDRTGDDVFRDCAVIDDELFERRIGAILHELRQ